jgi:hypothetical protein
MIIAQAGANQLTNGTLFRALLSNTQFAGVSGRVALDVHTFLRQTYPWEMHIFTPNSTNTYPKIVVARLHPSHIESSTVADRITS